MKKLYKISFIIVLVLGMFVAGFTKISAYTVANVELHSTIEDNHSFIVVKNPTSSTLVIGNYQIAPFGSVTLGTWGNIKEHKGLWYNLEGFYGSSSRVSIVKAIDVTALNLMNGTIKSNNSWSLLNNCSSFANKVWNSFSNQKVNAGTPNTPSKLAISIKSVFSSTSKTNVSIPSKTRSDFNYDSGTGLVSVPYPTGGGSSSSFTNENNDQNMIINNKYINSFDPLDFSDIKYRRADH